MTVIVTVSADEAATRLKQAGQTRRLRWAGHVPNWEASEKEADLEKAFILNGIIRIHEAPQGDTTNILFIKAIQSYSSRFYHRFSREEQSNLIRFLYSYATAPGQRGSAVNEALDTIKTLISGARLTREDLILPWRPVYDLLYSTIYGKNEKVQTSAPITLAELVKKFFPVDSTAEIWNELSLFRDYENSDRFLQLCLAFLPTNLTIAQHAEIGAVHWWKEMWTRYDKLEMNGANFHHLQLLTKLQKDCPGYIDWNPMYERVFSDILRGLQFPTRGRGKAIPEGAQECLLTTVHADLVVYTYGHENGSDDYLWRLFDYIGHELHPFHEDTHSIVAMSLLSHLCNQLVTRYRREHVKPKKDKLDSRYKLTDEKIRLFVTKILPLVIPAMFSDVCSLALPSILHKLSFFAPDLVLPRIIEHIHPSLRSQTAPTRLPHLLALMSRLVLPLTQSRFMLSNMPQDIPFVDELGAVVLPTSIDSYSPRIHAILLLDEIIDLIDLTNITRTLEICNLLYYIFMVIPVFDCQQLLKGKRLEFDEEEKQLIPFTAKLPAIVDRVVEKLLYVVDVLCTPVPVYSTDIFGSLSLDKDNANHTSDEDLLIDSTLAATFTSIADAGSSHITNRVASRLLNLVLTSTHEHINASRIYTTMIEFLVTHTPEHWPTLYAHIYEKLEQALDEKTRAEKRLSNHVVWYAQMVYSLCNVSWKVVQQYENEMYALLSLCLSCANKRIWRGAAKSLCGLIYRLLSTYPANTENRKKRNATSLDERNPLKEWGEVYSEKSFTMTWYVPDVENVKSASRFMTFAFRAMEALEKPEKLERDELEKQLWIVRACYEQIVWNLPKPPKRAVVHSKISVYPLSQDCLPDPDQDMVISCLDGSAFTPRLLSTLEKLQNYLLAHREEDVDSLRMISQILIFIISPCNANADDEVLLAQTIATFHSQILNPITLEAAYGYCEKAIFHEYMSCMVDKPNGEYDLVRDVAVRMLCQLAVSRYPEVSTTARSIVQQFSAIYRGALISVGNVLIELMKDPKIEDEALVPILDTILASGLCESSFPDTRLTIWRALLNLKPVHLAGAVDSFESVLNTALLGVSENLSYLRPRKLVKYSKELLDLCTAWRQQLVPSPIWIEYEKNGGFSAALVKWNAHIEDCRKTHGEVVEMLKEASTNRNLLHNRSQWAKQMLLLVQYKHIDLPTIQQALNWLTHEMQTIRIKAISSLGKFLTQHKPKRNTINWEGPPRLLSSNYLFILTSTLGPDDCGVLPHNIATSYDATDLPNSEAKWNKTIFTTHFFGYRFPKSLLVTRPREFGEPIERGPLTEKEMIIANYFENFNNIQQLVKLLIIEKSTGGDCESFKDVALLWKYLLRNFPGNTKIFEHMVTIAKKLISGKTKEEHSLALDFVTGLILGTRHYSYAQLETMWNWLRPTLTRFVETINSEAEANWSTMVRRVLTRNDWRRFWWLVELSIDLVQSASFSTSRKFEVRFNTLPEVCTRNASVFNRLMAAAWRCCEMAFMDTDRVTLSNVFLISAQLESMSTFLQGKRELPEIPSVLLPIPFDRILGNFLKHLHFVISQPSTPPVMENVNEGPKSLTIAVLSKEETEKTFDLVPAILRLQGASPIRTIGSKRQALSASTDLTNTGVFCDLNSNTDDHSPTKKARLSSGAIKSRNDSLVVATPLRKQTRQVEDVPLLYLRILIDTVWSYYETQSRALTPSLLALIPPLLLLCSNDDENGQLVETAWADTRQKANTLIFDYMAACPVSEHYADAFLETIEKTYARSPLYRFKVSVLKFAQTSVLSNHYVYLKNTRRDRIQKLIITGISDVSIEVRKVAANALISLLQTVFLDPNQPQLMTHFLALWAQRDIGARESGCAGLCSLMMACPPGLPPRSTQAYSEFAARYSNLLLALCRLTHDPHHKIREYAGNCLRTFRASRRDEWVETRLLLGKTISDAIENAGEPSYYV